MMHWSLNLAHIKAGHFESGYSVSTGHVIEIFWICVTTVGKSFVRICLCHQTVEFGAIIYKEVNDKTSDCGTASSRAEKQKMITSSHVALGTLEALYLCVILVKL